MSYMQVENVVLITMALGWIPIQLWIWFPTLKSYIGAEDEIRYRFKSDDCDTAAKNTVFYSIILWTIAYFVASIIMASTWPASIPALIIAIIIHCAHLHNKAKKCCESKEVVTIGD